ncbi:glycosyltransferase family 4 protein [Planococcus sp. ISL-110]|uniref:glycosyltransferase family 4 protein n=1 Tax=Planococcus sp. ISL-110 TaxID=2819167 RepID=UPI001BEA8074|nr:glycosyltransferase family 4 protein [Planococcus sp. ISL-110]MBT2572021.1 glycosyltransferase family 4 protein [Planococcus sp. ISL-110]
MKVVLLAPTPPPAGGIASWTVRMQNATLKNGWKVEVVDEKLLGNREVFGGKTNKNLLMEIKRCIRIWKDLINSLKDDDVKVVHSCIPASTLGMLREYVCAHISKFNRKKFIIHYRCTIPNMCTSKIGKTVFKLLTNKSDLVIALNSQSMDFAKTYSETPVMVIPNFIEKSAISNNNSKKNSERVKRILYVGGVIKSKGCEDIIKVAWEFPNINFRFVGNIDPEVYNQSIPQNVEFCGEKNKLEVRQEMIEADIFMFVSYFPGEGFSNALAEAMASGLPCIASDWAANKDMLEEEGGIIVPIKDTVKMKRAIELLQNNKDLRNSQSNWNISKVKRYYTEKIVTDMYVNEYEKLTKL